MRWTATSKHWDGIDDTYGLMTIRGEPTLACLGKQLFAQHVRFGDWIAFPRGRPQEPHLARTTGWFRSRSEGLSHSMATDRGRLLYPD